MITPAYVRTMARYNAEMNRRLYDDAKLTPTNSARQITAHSGARSTAR